MSTSLLLSPGFLVALATLLLNDHVLKSAFGNALTGKLSDVAGVVALALFLTSVWPKRRTAVHVGVALAFMLWKSPLADAPLAAWNALGVWPMARMLDYSDWLAVLVLPASWWYAVRARRLQRIAVFKPAIVLVASVAFMATSRSEKYVADGYRFDLPYSQRQVYAAMREIDALAAWKPRDSLGRVPPLDSGAAFWFSHSDRNWGDTIMIVPLFERNYEYATWVEMVARTVDTTSLTLLRVSVWEEDKHTVRELRQIFADSILGPLQRRLALNAKKH